MNEVFRVYTSPDMLGIELGGSLKNVIALAQVSQMAWAMAIIQKRRLSQEELQKYPDWVLLWAALLRVSTVDRYRRFDRYMCQCSQP